MPPAPERKKTAVKMSVKLPSPRSRDAAAQQKAAALLNEAKQAVTGGKETPERAAKRREEFQRLAAPPSDTPGETSPQEQQEELDQPRRRITHWRAWCREATEVSQRYQSGTEATKAITDLQDDAFSIPLPDSADDARRMVALKKELQGHAEQLASAAYDEMKAAMKVKDYRKVRRVLVAHERIAETNEKTRRQWVQLSEHRDSLLDDARSTVQELTNTEASVVVLEKRLAELEEFASDLRMEFDKAREEVQMREDTARYELQKVVKDREATIGELSAMIQKWIAASSVTKERDAVQKRLTVDIGTARASMESATACDAILVIDACLGQYARTCGDQLSNEIEELSRRRQQLREDMRDRLTSAAEDEAQPDPMQLFLLLERSNDYGADFDNPRRKAAKRLQQMEKSAEAEIREAIPSADYAKITAVLKKYEGWPATIQGALGMLENRREWLLGEARSACRRTRISTDVTVLHAALEKYADYRTDCPPYSQVQKQHDKQLAAAIADLRETTVNASATLKEVEAVITRWNGVPGTQDAGNVLAERLARMAAPAEAELQRACGEPRLSDVDAVLQKYTREGGPSLLASTAMLNLKRHRSKLCDDTRAKLRSGLALEDALDIASLLEDTVEYEQDLTSDRKALRQQRLKLAKKAAGFMEKLQSTKEFAGVEKMLARYERCPPEALAAREGLRKHRGNLIAKADKALARALEDDVPGIDTTLQKYHEYAEACKQATQALLARRDARVQGIRGELDQCVTLVDLKKWEGKYGSYKAISGLVKEMKERFAYIVREITAECNAAADTKDYPVVEQTLHRHERWAKHVDMPYKNLRRLCIQLVTSMESDLKQCTAGILPRPILAVVKRSLVFGESVAKPRAAAQSRIAQLIQKAETAMNDMCKSTRYTAILETLAQYENFADQTQATWDTLCKHRDSLIAKAKADVFKLAEETDPNVIDKTLAKYSGKDRDYPGYDYGNVVEDAVCAAMKRRAQLIDVAVEEMQAVLMGAEEEGQDKIRNVLQKYKAYPADLDEQRDLLKTTNKMKCQSTTDRIRTAARSQDFEVVDLCLSYCLQQQVDSSLTPLVDKLHQHRARLVDHAVDKLENSLNCTKPAEIDRALDEAGPLFASAVRHGQLLQAATGKTVGTPGDEATRVLKLRETVETHRSDLVADCVTKMDKILADDIPKVLEKSLEDLVAFKNVEACKQKYKDMETNLKTHQHELRRQVNELLLLDNPHPNDIKRLLADREKYGPSAAAEERRLSTVLSKVVRRGNAQMLTLKNSKDYAEVRTAVQHFSDFPCEFADNFQLLRRHRAELLETAVEKFRTMCKEATHPNEIFSKAPAYYDVFLDEFEPQKEVADARVSQMVQRANDDMRAAHAGRTIWEMQATVDKYADYPKQETEEARATLGAAIVKLAENQSSVLLALCDGEDIPKIDAALAEKPFPLVVEAHTALQEHRDKLEAAASQVCDKALEATLPKDLDAALGHARPFGRSLELKRTAVTKRRRTVIKDARTKMSKVDTNSFPLVDAAVAEFDGFATDTDAPWKMLVARRKELLDGSKEVLRQALTLQDPLQVEQVVERSSPFVPYVAEEQQAAVKHAAALCESACAALNTAREKLRTGECTLAAVEASLDEYSYLSAHPPVQGAFEDLAHAFDAGCNDLARIVTEAIALPDIVHCHKLIEKHSTGCRATKEMVEKLVSHRADLTAEYRTRITKATAFVVDIDAVAMLLEEVAPHEKHIGSKSISALKAYLNELVNANLRELNSMLKSEDFSKVCQVLEKHGDDEGKARVPVKLKQAISRLRQHRAGLVEKARAKLKPLSEEQDPNIIDRVVKAHAPFGDTVEPELSQALAHRKKLIDDAIGDMLSNTAVSTFKTLSPQSLTELVRSLHSVVHRYAHFPDADMESTRKELHKYTERVISACDDRLNQALAFSTVDEAKEIRKMLQEFAPIEDDVAESFQLAVLHLERIWKWDAKKFTRPTMQPYEQEKEELQTAKMAKSARKQEQLVFKAVEDTYALDQLNVSDKLFRESTPAKILREHSMLANREPKMRPSAALMRAGREVQREACSSLFKGGSVYYSPTFDYHKLEWTMEDELAARFASEEPEDESFSRPVTVELSLAMDYDSAVADPTKRDEFTKNFIVDMAKSLGCDPALLQVEGLSKGSVIVKFTLKASPSGDGPSPVALGAKLNAMMQDPSSALTKSKLLNRVNRARGLLVAAKPLPKTKVLQLNHKKGMVNSREFSLALYVDKFRAETRLGRLQLKESNVGLMASLDSTWEQLKSLEQEHERLYNDCMKLHNELQWIEQPYLWQQLEEEKQKLRTRLESNEKELPKIVLRSGMSDGGRDGWSDTGWMDNRDTTGEIGSGVLPHPSPQKIPVPPDRKKRARRASAPVRKVSRLRDGAIISAPAPASAVDVQADDRHVSAAVIVQCFVRGRKVRKNLKVELERRQQDAMLKKQLAERHGLNVEQLPTKMEIADACRELGINSLDPGDKELVWIAEEYLLAPLPKGWTEMYLAQYKAVAYITEQGKSSWAHPRKGYYVGLVRELRRLRAEYMFVAKAGLFEVAKVGAKIQGVLNAHTAEQKRLLAAEAGQLTGAEWTESTYAVDGDFAGSHLTKAVAKQKAHANAYDPRRIMMGKIRDKRKQMMALEQSGDPAAKDAIQNLVIEIGVLEEDLKEEHVRVESSSDSLFLRPGVSDEASEDALAGLPALPPATPYQLQPRLTNG